VAASFSFVAVATSVRLAERARRNEKAGEKSSRRFIMQKGVGAQDALKIVKNLKFHRYRGNMSRGTPFLSPNIGASALSLDDFNLNVAKT
jgi:hypothetical protein